MVAFLPVVVNLPCRRHFLNHPETNLLTLDEEMAAIKLSLLNHWYSCEIRQFKSYLRLPSKGYSH